MARGGFRPGAGRPKGSVTIAGKVRVKREVESRLVREKSPLEYMLTVMNDSGADDQRRDRMAIAAAPFVHARVSDQGKKENQEELSRDAESGTEWAGLLQ